MAIGGEQVSKGPAPMAPRSLESARRTDRRGRSTKPKKSGNQKKIRSLSGSRSTNKPQKGRVQSISLSRKQTPSRRAQKRMKQKKVRKRERMERRKDRRVKIRGKIERMRKREEEKKEMEAISDKEESEPISGAASDKSDQESIDNKKKRKKTSSGSSGSAGTPIKKKKRLKLAFSARQLQLKDKNKKLRKRRKKHRRHLRVRKRRLQMHLQAKKHRKAMLMSKAKELTVDQLKKMIVKLRKKRKKVLLKIRVEKIQSCKEKREARRALRRAARAGRHRKKKYARYRRMLKRKVKKMKKEKEKEKEKEKAKDPVKKRVQWKKVVRKRKRVGYKRKFTVRKVTVNVVEPVNKEVHFKKNEKVNLDTQSFRFREDIVGNFGTVMGKCISKPKDDEKPVPDPIGEKEEEKKAMEQIMNAKNNYFYEVEFPRQAIDLRYQTTMMDDKLGSKDGKIIAQLNKSGSQNALRIFNFGFQQNIQFIVTSQSDVNLADVLKKFPRLDSSIHMFLVQQTFFCIRDLHKIGHAHLQVRPSSFSIDKFRQHTVHFNSFHLATPLDDLFSEQRIAGEYDLKAMNKSRRAALPKNPIDPYMSRRQHFRQKKGCADDYESWFYLCVRIVNGEPLKWEKLTDHLKMAMAKYEFVKAYGHPDPVIDKNMKTIYKYALSASEAKSEKVAYFLEQFIQNWRDSVPKVEKFPWQNMGLKEVTKEEEQAKEAKRKEEEKKKEAEEKEEEDRKKEEERKKREAK